MNGRRRDRIVSQGAAVVLAALAVGGYFAFRSTGEKVSSAESAGTHERGATKPNPHEAPRPDLALRVIPTPGKDADEGEILLHDEEIRDLVNEVPSEALAKAARLPRVEPRAGVAEKGLDALVSLRPCAGAYELVTDGRQRAGALGCGRREANGSLTFDGSVGFRREMPVPPGVPAMPPRYEVGEFVEGKREGVFSTFDAKGRLLGQQTFREGKMSGPGDEFNEEGFHLARLNYLDGNLHGPGVRYLGDEVAIELWGYSVPLDPKTGIRRPSGRELELARAKP